jgi:hypothetical protein
MTLWKHAPNAARDDAGVHRGRWRRLPLTRPHPGDPVVAGNIGNLQVSRALKQIDDRDAERTPQITIR